MVPGTRTATLARWQLLLAAAWLGALLTVAGIATPAPFAALAKAEAGRVVARVLASEAALSLALGALLMGLERWRLRSIAGADAPVGRGFTAAFGLAAAAMFCTLAGYYAVQPMMQSARAGAPGPGFAVLHGVSTAFYAVKLACVSALAWRLSRPTAANGSGAGA